LRFFDLDTDIEVLGLEQLGVKAMTIKPVKLVRYFSFLYRVLFLFSVVLSQAHADIKLSFGLYSSETPTTLVKQFRPIINSLEKKLSRELATDVSIKLSISKSYEDGIDSLVNGQVDFARFGPASYVSASERNQGISLLAMETKQGKKEFKGIICVHKDSPIKTVADLKGKRFAFGSEKSTIGRYLSQKYLLEHGVKASDLAAYEYLGRHDKVGYAVAKGKFDAGALKENTMKKLIKAGLPLRAIAEFNNVSKPWIARANLDEKLVAALKNALINFDDKQALSVIKFDGFSAADDNDYKKIREAIKSNPSFF